MKQKHTRWLALLLAMISILSLLGSTALAADEPTDIKASLAEGSTSVTITGGTRLEVLGKSTGGTIGGRGWTYTSNTGVTGPAFCVNWGLDMVSPSKRLEITGRYDRSPKTMGAFANGYPQRTLEQFKELHPDIQGIENLTETEYAYATQVAIWATCGQLKVEGTAFEEGRATLVKPTSDAQQIRVYESVVEILKLANGWTQQLYTGLYFHMDEDRLGSVLTIYNENGLEGAAGLPDTGIRRETINGQDYYTRTMYVDSATSTWIHDHVILIYSMDAPAGTIFTDVNNNVLNTRSQWGASMYEVPSGTQKRTGLNANGVAYGGAFKLCVPCDKVGDSGSISLKAHASVAQFNLYIANNPDATEQSYIIADPAYTGLFADGKFEWDTIEHIPETASLQIQKVDNAAMPLEGAAFTLVGSKGTSRTGISDHAGMIVWTDLPTDETYVLSETQSPPGYTLVEPRNITLVDGQAAHVVIQNDTERHFIIKKIDKQSGATLQGAVFQFEQIDGDYKTTGTTGFDGMIEFSGDELPYGSYRVFEIDAPEGYELDTSVQTVNWDGTRDITLTFQNVREPTIIVSKVDGITGISLPGATFNIYKDGELIDTATTNDAGEFRFPVVAGEGYYEFEETIAPAGYQLDGTRHGIYVDPYDPQTQDDPVLTIENYNNPSLRIIKIDKVSGDRMPGITFEIYKDGELFDTLETDGQGEIVLYDLEPGTYLVQEVRTDDGHVLNSTPQQIELKAGEQRTQTLVFVNQQKPGIYLIKLDSQTMQSIPNVRFEFKKVGGSYTQEFVTDANGEIDISKLDPGAYEVRELEAPEGYLIDDAVRVVQVNPDENASFVFTNTKKPDLLLVKYDPNTGKYLAGATFRIAKIEDGTHYLDRVTDINGRIELKGLEPGVYSVVELEAPAGYVKNETEFHVELFPGRESQLVVNNEAKPNLKIIKTDADSGEPVPGVTFTIKFADGRTVTTEATDENGEVYLEDMDPGVYEIWEQSVPDNYILAEEHQHITLVPNQTHTVQFQNFKRPTLVIKKVDLNGKLLPGAIFEVKTKDGVKIGDFPVDDNGTITVSNVHLNEGYFIITEIQAPEGYILDKTPHEVYLRPGKTTEISIENEKKPDLIIEKLDSVVKDGLKGAKFEIWVAKDKSTDGAYERLDSNFYYTDENGRILLDNLDTGWYKIVEVEPPAGFELKAPSEQTVYVDNDKSVTVTFENVPKSALIIRKIDADTGAGLANAWFRVRYLGGTSGSGGTIIGEYQTSSNGNIIVTGLDAGTYVCEEISAPDGYVLDTASQTAYISGKEQDCITLTFTNSKYGSLLIKKVDAVTGKPLADVEFLVLDSDGAVVGNANGKYVTDSAGTILISDIMPGTTLVVKEIRTVSGYVLDETPQTIKVQSNATMTLEFRNQPKGGLIIRKIDSETGEPLAGVEFKITTASGELVPDNEGMTSTNGLYTTDGNGQIVLSKLQPGTYIVTETRTLDTHILDAAPQTVVVNASDVQTLTFRNTPKGCLLITKVDSVTKEPLSGVEFRIVGCDGCEYPAGTYVTDANGNIRLTGVPSGCYAVTETKAKAGYLLDNTTHTVKVEGGSCKEVTFENAPLGGLLIKKMDSETKEPLSDVIFRVTTAEGTVVGSSNGEYRTDENGYISIPDLKPGSYIVQEVEAKTGYLLDDTPRNIQIRDHETYTLEFFNKPVGALVIKKMDSETKEPLSDVLFKVTTTDGMIVGSSNGEFRTDENGYISISGLKPGGYIVQEVKAKDGYLLDDTPKTIEIKDHGTYTLEFFNQPLGGLIIHKLDSVTKEPLEGVQFEITYSDGRYVDAAGGKLSSNGLYWTDKNGQIKLSGITGTLVVTEVQTIEGYTIDEATRSQTVTINPDDTQTLYFYNTPIGGVEIIKVDANNKSTRIPNVTFEIRRMDDGLVETVTTGKNGRVFASLADGAYYAVEIEAGEGYRLDSTPQYFEVVDGKTTTLTVTNEAFTGLIIHKVDSVTGKGVYGVTFLLYDGGMNPVTQVTTDQNGYAYVDDLGFTGKMYLREMEAEGYVMDTQLKTIYVKAGETTEVTWENTPITAQIQIWKKSADDNTINGFPAGTPLEGAVFEIYDKANRLVDTIKSDHRGLAVSSPLPLGRYIVKEVKAPAYYGVNSEAVTVYLEHAGQIVQIEVLNKSVYTNVSISKSGYTQVVPGQSIRYTFKDIGNNSTVPLDSFYWRDTLPTDAVRLNKIITGTWSANLNYKVVFQTNINNEYRVLADNLSTQKNYTLDASPAALGLASNEHVTQITFLFGRVPGNFKQVETPYIYCDVLSTLTHEYRFTNKCDVGGIWQNQWIQATDRWVTITYRGGPTPTLPRTGY